MQKSFGLSATTSGSVSDASVYEHRVSVPDYLLLSLDEELVPVLRPGGSLASCLGDPPWASEAAWRPLLYPLYRQALETGLAQRGSCLPLERPSGVSYWDVWVRPELDASHGVAALRVWMCDVTEDWAAAEVSRIAATSQADLIASLPDGTLSVDSTGRVVIWNRAAEELVGVPASRVVGLAGEEVGQQVYGYRRPLLPQVLLQPRHRVEEDLKRYYPEARWEGEDTVYAETTLPSGRLLWTKASRIRDAEGRIVGAVQAVRDVTDRREEERERELLVQRLREAVADAERQRSQLAAVFETMRDGVAICDLQGQFVLINEAEARINGFGSPEEMLRSVDYFAQVYQLSEEDRELPVEEWPVSRVLRGEVIQNWELHGRRKDTGQEWEFSFSGGPVRDAEGRQILGLVITRDITERKQAEVALRESEERLRLAMESTGLGTWDFLPLTGEMRWSESCKALYGLRPDAKVDLETLLRLVHPEDRQRVIEAREQALDPAGDGQYHLEYRVVCPDGQERWIDARGRAYFSTVEGARRPTRFIGTAVDVTELRQAHQRLELALEKEQRVSELLQRALLPVEPLSVEGYQVAAAYLPADIHRFVGGDFYDIFRTRDGKVGLLLGDVSGKGAQAAAHASATRHLLRGFVYDTSSPVEAMRKANAALFDQMEASGHFATAFLGVLDPASGELRYSSAGHEPAILCRASGEHHEAEAEGLVLGVLEDLPNEEYRATLEVGDCLVLYTDGLSEVRGAAGHLQLEGILSCLASLHPTDAQQTADGLVRAARAWAFDGRLHDDTALLVVKRLPPERPLT